MLFLRKLAYALTIVSLIAMAISLIAMLWVNPIHLYDLFRLAVSFFGIMFFSLITYALCE